MGFQLSARETPNIVLILADDLGAECFGAYGGTSYSTPQIDRMASEGIKFENAYALPYCTPTRAEIMTGRYWFRMGLGGGVILPKDPHDKQIDWGRNIPLASVLKSAGYATSVSGKWHLCHDFEDNPTHIADAGFTDRCMWRLFADSEKGGSEVTRHYWNARLWLNDAPDDQRCSDKFGDDLFCSNVISFIRQHADEPFFVYYPMTLVHSQTRTGKTYPCSPDNRKSGSNLDANYGGSAQAGAANLIAYMDKLVGRINDELDALNLSSKTLVLFMADNGTTRAGGKDGLTSVCNGVTVPGGKGTMTEAGNRVPLIIRWPGTVKPGTICNDIVDSTDIFATVVDAGGTSLPDGYQIDGRSFLPQLRGEKGSPGKWTYRQDGSRWLVRNSRYSLDNNNKLLDLKNRYQAEELKGPDCKKIRAELDSIRKQIQGSKLSDGTYQFSRK